MYPRGLKSSLIFNLLLVLSGAMLLSDLVMLGAARQEQLRERLNTGQTLLAAAAALSAGPDVQGLGNQLSVILDEAEAGCLKIFDRSGNPIADQSVCNNDALLRQAALGTIASGLPAGAVSGGGLGLLWPGKSSLLVTRPLLHGNQVVGALAAELSLFSLYQSLRNTQRAFFVYFLINLTLFVLLGFFRLYRSIVRPIDRLVATASEFRDDDQFSFRAEERDSEFNRLSRSLNQMLSRIKRDRLKLEESVTSLEEANRGLRRAQQEIIRAEKLASVGRLSAGIAHEIGNPMGIIAGYLELLKQPGLPEEQRSDFIRRAVGETSRVNTIIRQLLDFARQPRDEQQGEVSVHAIIEEVRELCAMQPLLTGVDVRVEAGADNDRVRGSADQLKQVFLNLIINAADAINSQPQTNGAGTILVRTANQELRGDGIPLLIVDIIDNGPGFVEAELANIFDPFYTTKEPGKGTGLGLSICFTIVESLGGQINAATNPEGGARISLSLPQVPPVVCSEPVMEP
jgi:C4-dicarboxylate-specific signal transduction histidine kinase